MAEMRVEYVVDCTSSSSSKSCIKFCQRGLHIRKNFHAFRKYLLRLCDFTLQSD
jgi:hypothetical protein